MISSSKKLIPSSGMGNSTYTEWGWSSSERASSSACFVRTTRRSRRDCRNSGVVRAFMDYFEKRRCRKKATRSSDPKSGNGGAVVAQRGGQRRFRRERTAPLYWAIESGQKSAALALMAAGADVNLPCGRYKQTAMFIAASEGRVDILRAFIQYGADVTFADTSA